MANFITFILYFVSLGQKAVIYLFRGKLDLTRNLFFFVFCSRTKQRLNRLREGVEKTIILSAKLFVFVFCSTYIFADRVVVDPIYADMSTKRFLYAFPDAKSRSKCRGSNVLESANLGSQTLSQGSCRDSSRSRRISRRHPSFLDFTENLV